MKILITGGTGFFGTVLKNYLDRAGHHYINLDCINSPEDAAANKMAHVDLRDKEAVDNVFLQHGPFDAICHLAAALAHDVKDPKALWKSNVEGTRHLAEAARKHHVSTFIYTSTNCLWGKPLNRPVREEDLPCPIEVYGQSKLVAEKILAEYTSDFPVVIFRSSTIIAPGRIGLLSILFDFIAENRRLPVIGTGNKPYQFIDAEDYAAAIEKALTQSESDTFNIGSDNPSSLEQSYRYVIAQAHSKSQIYHLPKFPILDLMKLCHHLKLSPLGPYHYSMIAEEFVFDTNRIKEKLHWTPTKSNGEILFAAYDYYVQNKNFLETSAASLPAHRKASRMGIIKLLKWLS